MLGLSDTYNHALGKHDPGMAAARFTTLFDELKRELVPLARRIVGSPVTAPHGQLRGFPVEQQREFLSEVTQALGFDYGRGRIDVLLHPFFAGHGFDVRMTTRFDADNPRDSLFSAIHETGHGLYEQGLPREWIGTPLGEAVGMGIHESQSRLWEKHVARSRSFWRHWEPRFRAKFAPRLEGVSPDTLFPQPVDSRRSTRKPAQRRHTLPPRGIGVPQRGQSGTFGFGDIGRRRAPGVWGNDGALFHAPVRIIAPARATDGGFHPVCPAGLARWRRSPAG